MAISKIAKLVRLMVSSQEDVYGKDISVLDFPNMNYMDDFTYIDNSVKLIYDHVTNKVLFISNTAQTLGGYRPDEFYKLGLSFMLKIFTLEHYDFVYRWWKWSYDTHEQYHLDLGTKQVMCGVKCVHKEGHIIRMMLRQVGLKINEKGITTVSAYTIDDVTHLMKDDFYWGRIDSGKEENQYHHLMSTEKKSKPTDILSDREKDILRLLVQGKESKEIGQLMFISPHTVSNHRQNMMTKIGAKDTTSLVQLCRMASII